MTYFSHIFVFGILVFLIGLHISYKAIIQIVANPKHFKKIRIDSCRNAGLLLISSLIPLILFSFYFYSRPIAEDSVYITHVELLEWLKQIKPIIALNVLAEEVHTKKLFYLILALTVVVVYYRISEVISISNPTTKLKLKLTLKGSIKIVDFWFVASIVMLLLYFSLPDYDNSAGYISVRLALLFFLFYIIWLSVQKIPLWLGIIAACIVLYCNFKLNSYYNLKTKELSSIAKECHNASDYILPNSIVLPLNYSENWMLSHFSNYLGIDKPMVILDNYECDTGYFPLKWKDTSVPNTLFGNTSSNELSCLQWKSNSQNSSKVIDFVFVLGNIDANPSSCKQKIKEILSDKYILTYRSDHCKLYQLKTK